MSTPFDGPFDLWYPQLVKKVIHAAAPEARAALRHVSRNVRSKIDAWYPPHIVIKYDHTEGRLLVTTPSNSAAPQTLYQLEEHSYSTVNRHPSTPYFPALIKALYDKEKGYPLLSMTQTVDVDLYFWDHATFKWAELHDKLHEMMPLLKSVRRLDRKPPGGREPLLLLRVSVRFISFAKGWNWLTPPDRRDHPKYVFNIVEDVWDPTFLEESILEMPPTHEELVRWTSELDALATRRSTYGLDPSSMGEFVVTIPASFWHRFVKPFPSSLFSSLCWQVFSMLAGLCPWLHPIFDIRIDEPGTTATKNDSEMGVAERNTHAELECIKAAVKEDMMAILSELEFYWAIKDDDEDRSHIRNRVEGFNLLTADEYRALVGDSAFAIETRM